MCAVHVMVGIPGSRRSRRVGGVGFSGAVNRFLLWYPVTPESRAALARFSEIEKAAALPAAGRSPFEILRLLGSTHYDHVDRVLAFIDHELPVAGPIGARVATQTDPFQFREAVAELFLFSHLRRSLGPGVRPTELWSERGPDIEVAWQDLAVRFEVYSPVDLMGFQLLVEHLLPLFKYLEVSRGFVVEISFYPRDNSVKSVWYPYTLPKERDVLSWLHGVGRTARALLGRPAVAPGDQVRLPGPGASATFPIKVRGVFDDPDGRGVVFTAATRSTDARLLFECGTPEDTARPGWGRKLKEKMRNRQAGLPAPRVLRVLVVNFAQANTGWPEFFGWQGIARRLEDTVKLIAGELTASLHYDLVLPARLDLECCFGQPVWLNSSLEAQSAAFFEAAGLKRLCPRARAQAQDADLEELLELASDSARRESAGESTLGGEGRVADP